MFKTITKKYKAWFGDVRILFGLGILLLIGLLDNNGNEFISNSIVIVLFSIIFPLLTIFIDYLFRTKGGN